MLLAEVGYGGRQRERCPSCCSGYSGRAGEAGREVRYVLLGEGGEREIRV